MPAPPVAIVDFVADITCPWCTIGRRQLEAALQELARGGLVLDWIWRPFLINPEAPPGGVPQVEHLRRRFKSSAAAECYHRGVAEAGRAVGFDFRYDRIATTPNTVAAHGALLHAAATGAQHRLADRLAVAFFTEGLDIGRSDVLTALARDCGMEASVDVPGSRFKADVIAADRSAKLAGIRAVPAFCLHGKVLPVRDSDDLVGSLLSAHRSLG